MTVIATTWDAHSGPAAWAALGVCVLALVPCGARWLRVAQREHYLAGSVSRFGWRWWSSEPGDAVLGVVALGALGASFALPVAAFAVALAVAVAPFHLALRGRSAPLVFTPRLRRLTGLWLAFQLAIVGAGAAIGLPAGLAALGALCSPVLVDLACAAIAPVERRLGQRFVSDATRRLQRVHPRVVGITGSYGKTSTKNHIAHLLSGTLTVVASPASFNNRAGLARAINENLVDGTQVFVAEMGTYGIGEIAELCLWCPPEIAVITAIGPVHLERFGTEDRILEAKSEICAPASTVVLNVDDPRLARLADTLSGKTVLRCSATDIRADVAVTRDATGLTLWRAGRAVANQLPPVPAQPTNLACAAAVALALGVDESVVATRLGSIPGVANRLVSAPAASGVLVIDDTFNSNPAGSRAALEALAGAPASRRRVVVTPGMVELGRRQREENTRFAAAAAAIATDVVVVGQTNRRALFDGARAVHPVWVRTRPEAVAWVRTHLGVGDVVLYENDLPDHYP